MKKDFHSSFWGVFLGILSSFTVSFYMNPSSNNRVFTAFIFMMPFMVFFNRSIKGLSFKLREYDSKNRILALIVSAFICVLFFVSFLSHKNYSLPYNTFIVYVINISLFFLTYISVIFFYVIILELKININEKKPPKKKVFIYALPCAAVWLFYFIAFYPGVMSADSMNQWDQIITGKYWDANPVIHTLFNYVITRIWFSPAAISLAQIIIIAAIWGYCMYKFEAIGVNKKLLFLITIIFAFNPANGILTITLWKDVLYSGFLLLFTMNIISILMSGGQWIKERKNLIHFILSALGVVFFRHNGILPFVGTMMLIIWFYRKSAKPYITTFAIVIISYLLIRGPIYKALGVRPAASSEAFAIPTQQIAGVIRHKGHLTEEQVKKLNEIMPLEQWDKNYMPGNVDYIKFHKDFNSKKITEDKLGFLKLWLNICIQNPKMAIEAYGYQTGIAWSVKGYTNFGARDIIANDMGLKQTVINNKITYAANKLLNISQKEQIKFLFWRPALQGFLIIVFGLAAMIRNGKKAFLAICPVLLNILTVLIATPAQDFRYLYGNTMIYLIIIILGFIKIKR